MNHRHSTHRWPLIVPWLALAAGAVQAIALLVSTAEAEPATAKTDCYISTGDNDWAGELLPIDSKASIEASFELLARLGVRRVYWRGLQDATWNEVAQVREENCRYASWWRWYRHYYAEMDPDRTAAAAAKRQGMEFWGVGTLADWGSAADTPCYGIPNDAESVMRLKHPEWVPVDRSGLLKQAGPIEFAYPEARKALVDLHLKYARRDGYDGIIFLTYVENFGMRFQDEFGFNEPIVREFKRRTGVDLRTQPFTRAASRHDWYALRGEYLTLYLRELKQRLRGQGKQLGIFINPQEPYFTQPWPELMLTAGHIYCDLETWVRDGIVDQMVVYGSCQPAIQDRAVDNCLWLTRATPCKVSPLAQGPFDGRWKRYRDAGVSIVMSIGPEEAYLDRNMIPEQPLAALRSEDPLLRMRVLAEIIYGQIKPDARPGDTALAGPKCDHPPTGPHGPGQAQRPGVGPGHRAGARRPGELRPLCGRPCLRRQQPSREHGQDAGRRGSLSVRIRSWKRCSALCRRSGRCPRGAGHRRQHTCQPTGTIDRHAGVGRNAGQDAAKGFHRRPT